jgi:hypothetical protein
MPIDLSGSLMAGWVGKCAKLLERVSDAIRDHVFEAQAIFMDDTTVKLLQKGKGRGKNKTKTARLWVYARKENTWASGAPPAVWYQFSTSRGAEHPSQHLATYEGFAHADAYAGYNDAYRTGRVKEMACIAHVRREFFDLYPQRQKYLIRRPDQATLASEGRPLGECRSKRVTKAPKLITKNSGLAAAKQGWPDVIGMTGRMLRNTQI